MKLELTTAIIALALLARIDHAGAQGTAFTYQGQLQNNGSPASGTYNFSFSLYNAASGGAVIAGPVNTNGVVITNGLFLVTLGFGASVWNGATNWLQIEVETNGSHTFAILTPLQEVTPAPYAIYAQTASNLLGAVSLAQLPAGALGLVTNNEPGAVLGNLTLDGPTYFGGNLYLPSTHATLFAGLSPVLYYDGNDNFFAGVNAGLDISSGANNTGVGAEALRDVSSGSGNSAFGEDALISNNTGSNNVALGSGAMAFNQTGYGNTAVGINVLALSGSGINNTAIGENALVSDSGGGNTAVGGNALQYNGASYNNTAVGYQALSANGGPGIDNVAVGVNSLYSSTGAQNTSVGTYALQSFTSGSGNIALGYSAGQSLSSGNNNIYIGSPGSSSESGIIRIGTAGTHTATYLAGTAYCQILGITSDRNAKENFAAINPRQVLAKVAALPVTEWNYKTDRKDQQHIGPMAQDFQAAFGLNGRDDKHISMADEGGVALAAIQGLNQKLEQSNAELKQQNDLLAKRLNDLEQTMRSLLEEK